MTNDSAKTAWMATRQLHAVDDAGRVQSLALRIGFPHAVSDEEWACAWAIDGWLQEPLADVRGIDAWQALTLAMRLQAQLLAACLADGHRLIDPSSGAEIALEEVFPALPPAPRRHRRPGWGGCDGHRPPTTS